MLFLWHLKTKFLVERSVMRFFQTTLGFVIRENELVLPACGGFISTMVGDTNPNIPRF